VSLTRGGSSDTVRDSSRPSLEGSVRSILRDPKTPGTGQNVRFFSRDALKAISPDASASSSEPSPISFADRLARVARPSAMDVFAEADTSNLFNLSPGNEIPQGLKTPMLDTAIEIPEGFPQETSTPFRGFLEVPVDPSFALSPTSSTFSGEISIPPTSPPPRTRRSRALSDTVFQTMLRKHAPEADINDTSNASLVLVAEPPDPFRANATTYYTPGTMIPPTPPQPTHSRTASKEEDIIWNLRTQLALSQELCAQYEIDLGARDELVQALTQRAEVAEKEKEKSRNVLRGWKKKAGELERMCRTLEEEVDTSRHESLERSIMDEASGEALRMLHRQISQLEREKEALQDNADITHIRNQLCEKDVELGKLREEIKSRDDAERVLRDGIQEARAQMDYLTTNSVRSSMAEEALILANKEERERHLTIERAWAEERTRMVDVHEALQTDKNALANAVQRISSELERVNSERVTAIETAHKDLDAAHQESAEFYNTIEDLQNDNETLKSELEALETKLLNMEEEWSEGENRRVELESELQRVTEEVRRSPLRMISLTNISQHETRITSINAELTFANENVSRLESNMKERDTTISTLTTTLLTHTDEAESLREELTTLKVEHSRALSSQTRALQDLQTQEKDLRTQLEVAVREKVESEIMLGMSKERVGSLMDEVAKLRRTVHEMQQTSAARDVTIVQLRKERERDRQDVNGLNIALDSKQQELELVSPSIYLVCFHLM
jgi:chromosome segregation ATPase